ncbi:hypothetical protein ACWEPZ_03045 [Streptomyces sp. NPDC004288]
MTPTDNQIADLLRAGHAVAHVEKTLHVGGVRIREVRDRLRIPTNRPGPKAESIDEQFRRRTVATDDGHLVWPHVDGQLRVREGASVSAARYAFQQRYGRPPIGPVAPGCGTLRCVHPDHVEDQPMREALETQLAQIFGSAA